MKKLGRVLLIILLSVVALFVILWSGFDLVRYVIYSEYYACKTDVRNNPGLNDGFVCQGIACVDGSDKILVSGYMASGGKARIYVTDGNNNSYYVNVSKNGKMLKSHAGGVGCYGDNVYIAADDSLYRLSLHAILSTEHGGSVEVIDVTPVSNQASFMYIDDATQHLYVGEFHDGTHYVTDHPYGNNFAIVERFSLSDLSQPDMVYSIPDKVQGFCVTPDGKMIMSTSWGLNDSHYYVYEVAAATPIAGETFRGAQVYALGECIRDLKGPAMAEGLDYMEGKVITLSESASNKYVFGKFFFANQIVGLQF